MNWTVIQPIAAQAARDILRTVGAGMAAHGLIQSGPGVEAFVGAGMTLAGLFWGWFTTVGYIQVGKLLQKLTASHNHTDAVEKAQALPAPDPSTVNKAIIKAMPTALIALAFLGALAFPGDARAQVKLPQLKPLTGDPIKDFGLSGKDRSAAALNSIETVLAKPFQDIADFIGEDADGAVKLATAIPNIQDGHGQQCWIAMQSFGAIIKAHPIPVTFHVINDYESLRLLGIATNNLCSNVHCTQVFADFTAMAQAASPVPLAIPSLHDLCTKVPQIAVVDPVPVPATPAPAVPAAPAKGPTP
jgi:hypothetical protein